LNARAGFDPGYGIRCAESIWAYLPVGPLERHLRREIRGFERRGPKTDLQKEWIPFVEGTTSGKPLLVKCVDARCRKKLHDSQDFTFGP
jgi:hypothetical protein